MTKQLVYQEELSKLTEIFKDIDESKRKLVEGLIEDAAFLKSENQTLRETIAVTGMVKVHPAHPELQKPVESAKQYLRNINAYSVVIKTLNSILANRNIEDDDDLSEFE